MKIFITGGTGFIGQHLVRRLAETDHQLCCLARSTSDISLFEELGVNIVYGDMTDKPSLTAAMEGSDWVIDLANVYDFWLPDMSVFEEVNVIGTRNLMEVALETGVSKVVHVSTALIYGKPKDVPYTEESEPGPETFSEYARTKRIGDQIVWKMYEEDGLPLVVIYPVGVMGAGDTKSPARAVEDIVKGRMTATVFNDNVIVMVHVNDVVEAIVRAAEKEDDLGERYILGKEQITFGEYYDTVGEIAGVSPPAVEMPGWMTMLTAQTLTALSRITGQPPLLGLNIDQMRTYKEGYVCDGSKVERELGITYTPLREAFIEEIEQIRQAGN